MLITINNSLSNIAPLAISNLINIRFSKYSLRGDNILNLPKVNTTKHGLRSWRYFAAKKWNELSVDIRLNIETQQIIKSIRAISNFN